MSDDRHRMDLSHTELVSLYLVLSRHEKELDELQFRMLERIARELHTRLSVSQMEEIESYYEALDA